MTNAADWQGKVGANWAREWARTDRSFAPLNADLVARADTLAPDAAQVLDIGCGAGATSLALAANRPDVHIRGIDLSADLVARARARAGDAGHCQFELADATEWRDPAFHPNLLMSRHGVMFFEDPVSAFAHLAKVASPGAALIFSCFRPRSENEWASKIATVLDDAAPLQTDAPGPFAFANSDRVTDILSRAGWHDIRPEPVDFHYVAGSGTDPVADAVDFFTRIGPAAPAIRQTQGAHRKIIVDKLHALATAHLVGDTVCFAAAAWIWTARRV